VHPLIVEILLNVIYIFNPWTMNWSPWKSFVLVPCELLAYNNAKALIGSQTIVDDLPFHTNFGRWTIALLSCMERFFVIHQLKNFLHVIYRLIINSKNSSLNRAQWVTISCDDANTRFAFNFSPSPPINPQPLISHHKKFPPPTNVVDPLKN